MLSKCTFMVLSNSIGLKLLYKTILRCRLPNTKQQLLPNDTWNANVVLNLAKVTYFIFYFFYGLEGGLGG